ncbi:MAG: BatA domain-containing protein [Aureliella sp.]
MGLLAPLYALAALAIAAPVVFHLIRRQPRGQVEFSSLMFLQPSPPRLTRRSRLDNLWLLLIRAAVLGLIALAFARPFLRSAQLADAQPAGREILLLLDTSGSMQRDDVWQSALRSAKQYIDGLGEADRIGLATFDTDLRFVVDLPDDDELASVSSKTEQAAVRQELDHLKPSYRGTQLAEQLIAAAELLQSRAAGRNAALAGDSEIVLVSDLHEGAGLDGLQGYAWPERVRLDIRRVAPVQTGNARATLMQAVVAEPDSSSDAKKQDSLDKAAEKSSAIRVRVENNANSGDSALSLRWLARGQRSDAKDARESGPAVNIQVPPGQARIVPMPAAIGQADRIALSGDHAAFDNVINVPHTAPRQERLGFVGQTRNKPEDDLFYFLSRVPLSTPVRNVTIERMKAEELVAAATDETLAGLVVEWPLDRRAVSALEDFARTGRPVVVVLSRPIAAPAAASKGASNARSDASSDQASDDARDEASDEKSDASNRASDSNEVLAALLGQPSMELAEADSGDFALLTDIDFKHPLFQPLADAKFNDFGKVRFWSHRVLKLHESERHGQEQGDEPLRVLARFDDRSPAIIQRRVVRGDVWLLAAGWQTNASQLALSTKFVPLLYGMLDPEGRALETDAVYEVGEPIDVAAGAEVNVTKLDGSPVENASAGEAWVLEEPGLYWLSEDGRRRQIAVALPLSESRLDPLELDRFAQYGVVTGKSDSAKERQETARLSQVTELESRQKLWRWILIAALGLLVLETLLAARREKIPEPGLA